MPSAKVLEEKKMLVDQLAAKMKEAKAIVLADYRGLTVDQDTEMRETFRKEGLEYKVYKNTLTHLAATQNNLTDLYPYLEGPTSIAFSNTDPIAPAKLASQFAKKFEQFEVKAGVLEGKVIDKKALQELASLPSKEELLAKMLGSLNAPITGLVNVLNGNLRGLAVVLNAIKEKKEQSA